MRETVARVIDRLVCIIVSCLQQIIENKHSVHVLDFV